MSNQNRFGDIFPIAFYPDLHPDSGMNVSMNRCYNFSNDEEMLAEMREVSPRIHNIGEFVAEFLVLGERSAAAGHKLRAANYLRTAEFYMTVHNPRKEEYRRRFISLTREHFGIGDDCHFLVPYEAGAMSTYRFTPENPKGTFVMFSGFDMYSEELFGTALAMKLAGFDVVLFDGPGQGATLEDYQIPLTEQWEKPVGTVLDYFGLTDVTLIGVSLGGCLAMRAAAHEKRARRVVADDICLDFYETVRNKFPSWARGFIDYLVKHDNALHKAIFNSLAGRVQKKDLMVEWGLAQGMHVMGAETPYGFLRKCLLLNTYDVSPLVDQDVLLMGGQEDHYIPLHQFFEQGEILTNVRSLTMRLFTRQETAQNHCQLGNVGLSVEVIVDWVEQMLSQKK